MSEEQATVVVVEDEPDLADLYATWLEGDYDVHAAYGGEEALGVFDGLDDLDVVLLDRRMPDISGDEVLTALRDRGVDARVAMVTAVEPDFDIVAMGFDDYLVKPVSRETLEETVSKLLLRDEYADGVRELFSLASKKALLEAEKSAAELDGSEEYAELSDQIAVHRDELDATLNELSESSDLSELYRDLETEEPPSDDAD
ncbi:MAG: HalX domain-containing protein [Haloferacaceae archaeon]